MSDRRVRLDRVDDLVLADRDRVDRAMDRGHDPDGQRVDADVASERAPDRRDRLADDDVRGVSERERRQPGLAGVDLDDALPV